MRKHHKDNPVDEVKNLRNRFLLAMPGLGDPNFDKAVILVCEHTDEGALGIIINQPISITFEEVLTHMDLNSNDDKLKQLPVVFGGPVQQERGFIIHAPLGEWKASLPVGEELAVTASRDVIEAMVEGKGPERVLACLGYAGWGAGQLEEELSKNMWLDCPVDLDILFDSPFTSRWKAAGKLLGIDLSNISGDAGHA